MGRTHHTVIAFLSLITVYMLPSADTAVSITTPDKLLIDETMPDSIPQEIIADWKDQDGVSGDVKIGVINRIIKKLPAEYADRFKSETESLSAAADKSLFEKQYLLACHYRRVAKLKPYAEDLSAVMFARHHNFGGAGIGFHDNADKSNADSDWGTRGSLCLLKLIDTYYPAFKEILTKIGRVVRDPCISFDGRKVLFALSGGGKGTGYKIYEMEIDVPYSEKQLTFDPNIGQVVSDFEPCYLPNGNIAFTSTRNFGMNPQATNPNTNMFIMNGDGKYIRQVGFDQMNTFYPVLMDNGSILYSRCESNDRNVVCNMGLFTMNPDGCHQTEWFGNQTAWPLTLIHARPIPNSDKVIAVAGGYLGLYAGEVLIIDRTKGTNGPQSIKMVAPVRATKPKANESFIDGGIDFAFQTPYALDEKTFLVSWRKDESEMLNFNNNFSLYLMDTTGSRELLAWSYESLSQPVLVKPRKEPPRIAEQTIYYECTGEFTVQDVYHGAGMEGIKKGIAKSLRVVQLHYRVQKGSIGVTQPSNPAASFRPPVFCPIALNGCSWNAKTVLGETPIYPDGSASFTVPARTPVYFQVLDSLGYCIATMRSWSTLMPGEKFPCYGCHENKLEPLTVSEQMPMAGRPKPLEMPLGIEGKPFDYPRMVQPILDKHCVSCHTANHESGFNLSGTLFSAASKKWATSYSSLLEGIGPATSNKAVNINTIFSTPEQKKPYSFGACSSAIMTQVLYGTSHSDKIKTDITDKEKRIIACWIDLCAPHSGTYNSYMSASDSILYENHIQSRLKWAAIEADLLDIEPCMVAAGDDNSKRHEFLSVDNNTIRYLPAQRSLVFSKSGKGRIIIIDLTGKEIFSKQYSCHKTGGDMSIVLPSFLSTGLYIARIERANGFDQMKITFTE